MNEFKLGWKPLIACILGTGCGIIAITFYTQGLFLEPVTQEFGWSQGQFYDGFTIMMVAGLITAPLAGILVDSIGPRIVGMVGLIGHALGYYIISLNTGSPLLWKGSYLLLAIFAAGSLPVIWTTVINGWFYKYRGLAIGIMMGGSGLVAAIAPPLVEGLLSQYGWRVAYQTIGAGALLLSLPVVFFWLKVNDEVEETLMPNQRQQWGVTRAQALRDHKFWILGGAITLLVLAVSGVVPNFIPILVESGFTRFEAASIASSLGISIIIGRLSVGYLIDRFWAPGVAACFLVFPVFSLPLMAFSPGSTWAALTTAISLGLATGAILDLLAFLTSKYFGTRHYGSVFGTIFVFFTVSAGFAPNVYARTYEVFDNYVPVLLLAAVALILAMGQFLLLGKYPKESPAEKVAP